jgi:hypothetical protein
MVAKGPSRRLADTLHVGDVQVDELGEGGDAARPPRGRQLAAVDPALHLGGPAPRVLASLEALAYIPTLVAHLDTPGAGRELGERGHFRVRSVCKAAS